MPSKLDLPDIVADAVYSSILECACNLRADCLEAEERAFVKAGGDKAGDGTCPGRETTVLADILENARIGSDCSLPICQDTGSVWVCLEVGDGLSIDAGVFSKVQDAVGHAYADGKLRMSMVRDALFDRTNTGTNEPAFCEIKIVPGRRLRLHVMLKGGGSDNASQLKMLPPGAGRQGVIDFVVGCVREKAANACPPLLVGVGVGATFDKVAGLSKQALLRRIGDPAASPAAADFENELLEAINATGIGPAALGGSPTALAVHLVTAPCHIAALPVAVNMGCCAMRSKSIDLTGDDGDLVFRNGRS